MVLIRNWRYDVAIAGGGVAGLTAATFLARRGRSVALFERAQEVGGRAASQNKAGFTFNFGPHALFRAGKGIQVLKELGITIEEPAAGTSGSTAVRAGKIYPLPYSVLSVLMSALFTAGGRVETLKVLAGIPRLRCRDFDGMSVREWLQFRIRHPEVREYAEALIRVSTFCNAPDLLSAGAALAQLQTAFRGGVSYLNGGWQSLVDRLRAAATEAGAVIFANTCIKGIDRDGAVFTGFRLSDGSHVPADSAVIATPPSAALEILGPAAGPALRRSICDSVPVRVASLDLGLRRLPRPARTFALGLDAALYFSDHTRWGKLGPEGKTMVHVTQYLPCGTETDAGRDRRTLTDYLDLLQPEWDREIIAERYLPKMTVMGALPLASKNGLRGRAAPDAPEIRNVYLAGDWIGDEGMLSDAAFASARRAAHLLMESRQPLLHSQAV